MTPADIDISLRRLRGNLLANAGHFVVAVGIGVWMTPYLISNLGVATYGLVPLATDITSYLAIITVALSGSVGRFLAVDIARDDAEGAASTFNTSLFASLVLASLLLPVVGVFAWFAPTVLDVPPGDEGGARQLILAAGLAFLANTISSTFAASTFARNRFDLQRMVGTVGNITQALCVVLLFSVYDASLWQVGAAVLAMAVVRQTGYAILWRRLTPDIRISRLDFNRRKLRELLGMGGWLTVSRTGAILFVKAELLVANLVLGARAAGLYAPMLQWSLLLRALGGIVSGVLTPTFIAHHVSGDKSRLISVSQRAVKTLGLAMALPIGLITGLGEPLLHLWLGDEFAPLWPLLGIVTLHLCINVAITPVFGIWPALNKVLWPAIVTVIMGIINVGLGVWLAGPVGWGLYGLAIAGAVVLTAKNVLFTPLYAAHIVGCPLPTFLRGLALTLVGTLLVAGSARGVSVMLDLSSWSRLIAACLGIGVVYSLAAYYLGFSKSERETLKNLFGKARSEAV